MRPPMGSKIGQFLKQKKPKSTLLADNTQGLITTKQTKPRPVASAAPHPIIGYNEENNGKGFNTYIAEMGKEGAKQCVREK